ncbi:MAG: WYL domain-containing protein [Clostridia bacterium]|nr:WYL domain-containing protein [Clostridia bacterium]
MFFTQLSFCFSCIAFNEIIKDNIKIRYYNGGINRYQQLHYSKAVNEEYVLDTVYKSTDKNEIIAETYEYDYNPDTAFQFMPVTVSPYSIVWDNSRCYMICRPDGNEFSLRCVRVDRMFETEVIEEIKRELPPVTSKFYSKSSSSHFNTQKFMRSTFSMFPTREADITEAVFHVNY